MTGGGRGFCNPYSPMNTGVPYGAPGFGRAMGFRMGFGRGMGWGAAPVAPPSPEAELGFLEAQVQMLSQQLEALQTRIAEIKDDMPEGS